MCGMGAPDARSRDGGFAGLSKWQARGVAAMASGGGLLARRCALTADPIAVSAEATGSSEWSPLASWWVRFG